MWSVYTRRDVLDLEAIFAIASAGVVGPPVCTSEMPVVFCTDPRCDVLDLELALARSFFDIAVASAAGASAVRGSLSSLAAGFSRHDSHNVLEMVPAFSRSIKPSEIH